MAVDRPMIEFVRATIEREDPTASELDTQYPFRKRFDHCYRTFRWAQRINLIEGADADTVEIAALFHDAAKADGANHGVRAAAICKEYLLRNCIALERIDQIQDCVANHSGKPSSTETLSKELQIVMDADCLDEVGALAVLWDTMAEGAEETQSYLKTYQRLRMHAEQIFSGENRLHTATGRALYEARVDFRRLFLQQLEYELGLDEEGICI
jgi:uncharacterized protein